MKVLITGGHFSPAYELIKVLKKRGHEVAVAGRKYSLEGEKVESLEYKICQKEEIPFFEVNTGRFKRSVGAHTVPAIYKTVRGFASAVQILTKYKPDVILTFGGYVAFPISYAATFYMIPIVLHEQTQKAGLASKAIAKIAKKICVSYKSSEKYFPANKVVLTGNPVRSDLLEIKDKIDLPKGPVIYVTGGSTGSHAINMIVSRILETLIKDYVIIHQTGESEEFNDFDILEERKRTLSKEEQERYVLRKFIYPNEIGFVFSKADLILSRSGANILSEIIAAEKLSLLIPLPHGQKNEQLDNAKLVSELGIGEYIEEKDATPDLVLEKIKKIFDEKATYTKNMKQAKELMSEKPEEKIADVVEEVNGQKSN